MIKLLKKKKILLIYLFLQREEGKEKGRERNINVWLPLTCPPTGDLARKPSMCSDWDSNQQAFGSQAYTQSTEPHQPGLNSLESYLTYFEMRFEYLYLSLINPKGLNLNINVLQHNKNEQLSTVKDIKSSILLIKELK